MFYAVHSHCQGCEELSTVDNVLTDEQRKRGYHTRWIPAEELDDEDEPDELAPGKAPDPKLPGLE